MLVGLMSDSHDRVPAIRALLERMIERGAGMVLYGGDYCSPFSLLPFLELSVPFAGVFGRGHRVLSERESAERKSVTG